MAREILRRTGTPRLAGWRGVGSSALPSLTATRCPSGSVNPDHRAESSDHEEYLCHRRSEVALTPGVQLSQRSGGTADDPESCWLLAPVMFREIHQIRLADSHTGVSSHIQQVGEGPLVTGLPREP